MIVHKPGNYAIYYGVYEPWKDDAVRSFIFYLSDDALLLSYFVVCFFFFFSAAVTHKMQLN